MRRALEKSTVVATGTVALLLVCNSALGWPYFLSAYQAYRLLEEPERIHRYVVELQQEFDGSAPPRSGLGVPLPPGDASADAIRRLLAEKLGTELLTQELKSQIDGKPSKCILHSIPLSARLTLIRYGLIRRNSPYVEAKASKFPMAGYCVGGCLVGAARESLVLSCGSCDAAEKEWEAAQR